MEFNKNLQRLIILIREEEDKLLSEKTSWGRTEIKNLLESARSNAMMQLLTELSNGTTE